MTKAELTAENKPACRFNWLDKGAGAIEEWATHENEGGVEVFIILLDVVGVMVSCLLLVDGVEVNTRVIALDGLQERSESVLYARSWIPFSGRQASITTANAPFGIDFQRRRFSLTVVVHERAVVSTCLMLVTCVCGRKIWASLIPSRGQRALPEHNY